MVYVSYYASTVLNEKTETFYNRIEPSHHMMNFEKRHSELNETDDELTKEEKRNRYRNRLIIIIVCFVKKRKHAYRT